MWAETVIFRYLSSQYTLNTSFLDFLLDNVMNDNEDDEDDNSDKDFVPSCDSEDSESESGKRSFF